MNLKSIFVAGAATVAGVAGGVAVYQITAPADMETSEAAPAAAAATPKARASQGETRFAPCQAPSVLEGGKCVTTQVQTVTLPAPAAAAPAPAAAPQAAAPAAPKAAAPKAAAPKPAAAPAAPAPASQPAGDTGNSGPGYPDSSDCRKLLEHDYDNKQEKAELEADCAEDEADDRDDHDDDNSGSGSSGGGSSGSDSSGSGSSGSGSDDD